MSDGSFSAGRPGLPDASGVGGTSMCRWPVWVLLAAVFILFFQLGGRGLNEPDEGRYAEGGREMMASGDYLTPRLNGVPHYAKPPLTYWLIAFSLKTFGVNEFAARLPAAMAALGTLVAVWLMVRRTLGEVVGAWAALVLLTSVLFLGMARLISTDMILTCWITCSVWALWRWYDSPDRRWGRLIWFYLFLGLGMITKGPVAIVIPLFALAGLRWRNPGLSLRRMGWGRGVLVILAVSLPWFVAVTWNRPELWNYFLGREIAGRVLSGVHGRTQPWWFFLPVLAGGMLPWTPWLALSPLVRRILPPRESDLFRMCLVWALAGLLLFTLSRSKLPSYVLPLLPPMAVLTTLTLLRLPQAVSPARLRRLALRAGAVSVFVLVGGGVALAFVGPHRYGLPLVFALIPLAVASILAGAALVLMRVHGLSAGTATLAIAVIGLAASVVSLVPGIEQRLGGKTPAKYVAARIQTEDPRQQAPVIVIGKLPLGLPFYLNRTVLWYQPVTDSTNTVDAGGFEYRDAAGRSPSMIKTREQLQALLGGTNRVFCVADASGAAELVKQFGLRELTRDSRRVLLERNPE